MVTRINEFSSSGNAHIPSAKGLTFGIVVSDWNHEITEKLSDQAFQTLKSHGAHENDIFLNHVPGSIELTLGAQFLAEYNTMNAIICLGCVIQGETRHFDYVCDSVTQGITQLNLKYNIPFIYGVLTTKDTEQALERAGGRYGNKGSEAAVAAIRMAHLKKSLKGS